MSNTASALWASIVRTIVPIVVGAILGWIVSLGITVDAEFETLLTAAISGALTAVYYVAARLLETYVTPKLGWLLGLAKAPAIYTDEKPSDALSNAERIVRAASHK